MIFITRNPINASGNLWKYMQLCGIIANKFRSARFSKAFHIVFLYEFGHKGILEFLFINLLFLRNTYNRQSGEDRFLGRSNILVSRAWQIFSFTFLFLHTTQTWEILPYLSHQETFKEGQATQTLSIFLNITNIKKTLL